MAVFDLEGKIDLNSSGLVKGLQKSESMTKSFGKHMENSFGKLQKAAKWLIGGFFAKKVVDSVRSIATETAAMGDKIDKQSQALGLSRRAYQEWDYILSQNGASIDSLGVSMKTLSKAMTEGTKDTEEALSTIGITSNELKGLTQEKAFEQVVRAFQKLPAGAEKSAAAVKLFGRNGQDLLPLLNSDIYSIDILRQKAEDLGLVMSDDAVDASVAYTDSLDTMKRTFNTLKYAIGGQVLPIFTRAMDNITRYAGKVKKAYSENGLKGVFQLLVSEIKNIKWPSWKDIGNAITAGWNTIVSGVKGLAKIVFGENVDGSIAWPTWDQIGQLVTNAWNEIVNGVKGLAKLVFGENVDGTIAWPDVTKLSEDFSAWWNETALPALQKGMVWALTLFGMPQESAEQIASVISGWWSAIVDTAQSVLDWALHLPDSPHEAGAKLGEIISGWWKSVKSYAEGVLNWTLGLFGIGDSDGSETLKKVSGWWNDIVKPLLEGAINFVLGLFGLPSVDDMVKSITSWWQDVKNAVGNLFINIIPNILGIGGANPAENAHTMVIDGQTYSDPFNAFRDYQPQAKGLWDVPYNDFPALLHEGEMVLTKSQANDYRKGETGGSGAVVAAIQSLRQDMQNLRLEVNGKALGRATVDYGGDRMNNYIGKTERRVAAGYGW